ncbi:hypothetical protein TVAG_088240 [Trichomonas vaginalis G3]|uniref:KATNIP domain-containing protein n=1 Tax=Trichomonas vaginalis (strain ATCC PRA-98 / G3) TaxID=412133 RepID=A2FY84_TRIV3|nr:hypothetical protein TVAGG3_0446160 [Trichomonas vaginalis G3]EAX90131.1 hypothetical protein TVAG_088240 [Trichomonas vaginalis G3]KAI5537809.1 hypothetical protein TVAGG3_0446160 [Trichomonas vaginalis G3]|eukprot:XP_001303061.1 hypothetical protein [Trichomonas vaginalis G3]
MSTKPTLAALPRVRPSSLKPMPLKEGHKSTEPTVLNQPFPEISFQGPLPGIPAMSRKLSRRFSSVNSTTDASEAMKLARRKNSFSYKPAQLPSFELDYTITLHIMSNWGDPNEITVSEIDFLGEDKSSLKVTKVSPDIPTEDKNSFALMSNGVLVKANDNERWIHSWKQNQEPIVVHFTITSCQPPKFVRIWNTEDRSERNMKKFAVFLENEFVGSKEVPQQFGAVLPLTRMITPSSESVLKLVNFTTYFNELFKDAYGTLPIRKTSKIMIRIYRSFTDQDMHIGLNCIDIFDCKGNVIEQTDIRYLRIDGATNYSSPLNCFKEKKVGVAVNEIWIAERKYGEPIEFLIELQVPTQIALFRFYNLNFEEESYNLGVSDLSIFMDDVLAAQRRLGKADGPIYRNNKGITDVWVCQSNIIKDLPKIAEIFNVIYEE